MKITPADVESEPEGQNGRGNKCGCHRGIQTFESMCEMPPFESQKNMGWGEEFEEEQCPASRGQKLAQNGLTLQIYKVIHNQERTFILLSHYCYYPWFGPLSDQPRDSV